jgi:hypothetical protein
MFFFYAKTTPIHVKTGKGDTYEDIERYEGGGGATAIQLYIRRH